MEEMEMNTVMNEETDEIDTIDYEMEPEEESGKSGVAGLVAIGAGIGVGGYLLTTKVIVPGAKKAVGWVKGKFAKKPKDPSKEVIEVEAKEVPSEKAEEPKEETK